MWPCSARASALEDVVRKSLKILVDRSRLAVHIIHKKIIPKRVRSGEVSLTPAHLGYFLNELNQPIIACEHKSIDENSAFLAARNFLQRLADDQRIQAEGVLVDPAILKRGAADGFPSVIMMICRMSFFPGTAAFARESVRREYSCRRARPAPSRDRRCAALPLNHEREHNAKSRPGTGS